MIKKLQDYIFYKNDHYYASFPSAVNLPNGKVLLIFRRARDCRWLVDSNDPVSKKLKRQVDHIDSRSHLVQLSLNQQLEIISEPSVLPITPEAADQDASLLLQNDGTLLLSSFSWYPVPSRLFSSLQKSGVQMAGNQEDTGCYYIMWGGYTRKSVDYGQHWSPHQYLPPLPGASDIIPEKRPSSGGPSRGQAIEIGDEILLPVYNSLPEHGSDSCHLYVSCDQGESWQYRSMIAYDPQQHIHFNEPSLLHIEGETIMALMRTFNSGDHLYTAVSYDKGLSWQPWQKQAEIIGHPCHPLRLKDGRIFLCYGYRHEPFGIRARLMNDKAEKLIGDELIIRDDGLCGDLGYPWATQLENNDILVVYYFTGPDGIRHIAGTQLRLE